MRTWKEKGKPPYGGVRGEEEKHIDENMERER